MSSPRNLLAPGPFRADQIPEGSRYELSDGHAILCLPAGRRGARSNLLGGEVLETDPAVVSAGVDLGYSSGPRELRAPDVAVGDFPNEPGWTSVAPPLTVEYADTGQDEAELQDKIKELLAAGTKHIWVVRLTGPRRVEVYEPGKAMRIAQPGAELHAPGILQNPVAVLALFDRDAAHEATLRNLLQRRGYSSLDAVRDEGRDEGQLTHARAALRRVLARRGLTLTTAEATRIEVCADLATLDRWLDEAVVAPSVADALR